VLAPLLALVATAWLVLLVATPLLPTSIATLTYGVGSFICHQLPERSFHVGGFQLPVCARCLGIYAGLTIGTLTCLALRSAAVDGSTLSNEVSPHRGLSSRAARWTIVAAAFPTVTTVAVEWLGMWRVSNASRAAAGSVLGIGMAIVVMSALATLHYSSCVPRRPTVPNPPPPRT
jgi:uncharacterized membrane protein